MKTEIIAILDRSGSMESIITDSIGGFNAFVADQKKETGEARLTTVLFDTEYDVLYEGKPIGEVPIIDKRIWMPRGSTALNDAIGCTLNGQGRRINAEQWADKVIVVIVTDGHENASKEFLPEQVKGMISHAEKNGWTFIYLGANQDAFAIAQQYGISALNTATYDANSVGTRSAYGAAGQSVSSLRTTGTSGNLAEQLKKQEQKRA